jgi:hypothetical protein
MPNGVAHSAKLAKDPCAQKLAASMLAAGHKQVEVAAVIGVHQSQVSVWSRKPGIREKIQAETEKLIEKIPDAVEYTGHVLEIGRKANTSAHLKEYEIDDPENPGTKKKIMIPATDKDIANNIKVKALGWDAAKNVLTTAGILSSHNESRTVGMMMLTGDADALNPVIQGLVERLMPGDPTSIDVTPENDDSLFIPESEG